MANINTKDYYLSFMLGKEMYAFVVYEVLEVLPYQDITPIPKAPQSVLGIINFRGEILPVIDFKKKLMIRKESDLKKVIIVIEVVVQKTKILLGILVDGVKDVLEINQKDIKNMPEFGVEFKTEFLSGIYKSEEGFISILDINKIFSDDEILHLNDKIVNSSAAV